MPIMGIRLIQQNTGNIALYSLAHKLNMLKSSGTILSLFSVVEGNSAKHIELIEFNPT